ncbi:MAG: ACT domain-containing protein [Clostridia bacterium]|nr:ACT domain-containing protein [Clostridia bacterium]
MKRAVITVIGHDTVGILANIATACAEHKVNVLEVTQSVLQDMFVMMMMVDVTACDIPFAEFAEEMAGLGKKMNLSVQAMNEEIFNAMHTI